MTRGLLLLLSTCLVGGAAWAESALTWSGEEKISLVGEHDGHQLVLMTAIRDVTREAGFTSDPPGVIEIDGTGYVRPLRNGSARITATLDGGQSSTRLVEVTQHGETLPVSFENEIIPLFTRHGCNGGGCHGKADGQNGFRLSLFGYEPERDQEYLLQEGRGRRIFRAAPEHSLLVLKGSGQLPHEGGNRLVKDSKDYQLLVRWIRQLGSVPEGEPKAIERIVVAPGDRPGEAGAAQQLRVAAIFADGSSRDVTREAIYESNSPGMAEVDSRGLVQLKEKPGSVSVMVRFKEHVAVFRATIPLGEEVGALPVANNIIDEHVFAKLQSLGLPPSPVCDDSTFLRRVTVDIAGRLPSMEEARSFLADASPEKRARVIETLLDGGGYADYFAGKWAAILRNQRRNESNRPDTYAFHEWIRQSLQANRPYDEFVREILTATGEIRANPAVAWYRNVGGEKERMQDMAQAFLGVRLQCAQCHHHPYEKWSQDDYYGLTAFFTTLEHKRPRPGQEVLVHRPKAAKSKNPTSEQELGPTLPGQEPLQLSPEEDPRVALADWVVSKENPYFARMIANRYWKHFFGRGLVDPEDDMRVTNPPTHPALMDALEKHVVESGYDLKALVRLICNSRSYQLSSVPNEHNAGDQQNYARFYPRRLQAEVLADAINQLTNGSDVFRGQPVGARAVQLPDDQFAREFHFLAIFGRPNMASACECERVSNFSLAQAIQLVNSKDTRAKLTADRGRPALLLRDRTRTEADRIEELFLRAYARYPSAEDASIATSFLRETSGAEEDVQAAYEDLIWSLLNSREFIFNN